MEKEKRLKSIYGYLKAIFLFQLMRIGISTSLVNKSAFNPISVTFNITDNCNSKCITCNQWKNKSKNELSTKEIIDILRQLRKIGVYGVGFVGGEPLLRDDLPNIISSAKDMGFYRISLTTNSILLTEEKSKILLDCGVNDIGVSIDGIGITNDIIRGINGAYDKSISAINILIDLRKKYKYLNIRLSTTLINQNINQIESIVKMCKNMKIKISFNLPDNTSYFLSGINLPDLWINDRKKLYDIVKKLHIIKNEYSDVLDSHVSLNYICRYFNNPKKKYIPCLKGYISIYIDPQGNIFSGCWALKPMGNLRNNSLDCIIYNVRYIDRLKQMFMKKCPRCSCGYNIDLSYDLISIFKEFIYRIN